MARGNRIPRTPTRRPQDGANLSRVRTVNIHEAKTQLSRLLKAVERGEEVIVASAGKPVARLVPYLAEREKRPLGVARGAFTVSDDAFAPLTGQELALFEGSPLAETSRER
jgi:prevent-host-death family protein